MKYFIYLACVVAALSLVDGEKPTPRRRSVDLTTKRYAAVDRIARGKPAKRKEIPYIAALLLVDTVNQVGYGCGGSIIHENWVLTAAHCVEGVDEAYVRVGSLNFATGGKVLMSKDIIMHDDYDLNGQVINDIALINLTATPIRLNRHTVKKIRPVRKNETCNVAEKLIASGYGITHDAPNDTNERLMKTTLYEVSNFECIKMFGLGGNPSSTLCAKGKNGRDTCSGDSGGPIVYGRSLVGITSYGVSSCDNGDLGVYTRVGCYIDWLRAITGIDFEQEQDVNNKEN